MPRFQANHFISGLGLTRFTARINVYPPTASAPEIKIISERHIPEFLAKVATQTHQLHCELGGTIPFQVVKEIIDNLVHSDLCGTIITVFADGSGIRVSDQGPGIVHKNLATLPGFSTATPWHRKYIPGVGTGLAQASMLLGQQGGRIEITDNLQHGTVVSIFASQAASTGQVIPSKDTEMEGSNQPNGELVSDSQVILDSYAALTDRQRAIITVLSARGALGPSKLAEYINSSPSSTYRDMVALTDLGLLVLVDGGRRMLNPQVGQQLTKGIGDR